MRSISPETIKQAISEAYNSDNPNGKRELWSLFLQVMRRGISYEQGNPWKDIMTHWGEVDKQHKASRRRQWQQWMGGCGSHRMHHSLGCGQRRRYYGEPPRRY